MATGFCYGGTVCGRKKCQEILSLNNLLCKSKVFKNVKICIKTIVNHKHMANCLQPQHATNRLSGKGGKLLIFIILSI